MSFKPKSNNNYSLELYNSNNNNENQMSPNFFKLLNYFNVNNYNDLMYFFQQAKYFIQKLEYSYFYKQQINHLTPCKIQGKYIIFKNIANLFKDMIYYAIENKKYNAIIYLNNNQRQNKIIRLKWYFEKQKNNNSIGIYIGIGFQQRKTHPDNILLKYNYNSTNIEYYQKLRLTYLDRLLENYCLNKSLQTYAMQNFGILMVYHDSQRHVSYIKQAIIGYLLKHDALKICYDLSIICGDLCNKNNYKCHYNCLLQFEDVCIYFLFIFSY